MKKTKNYRVNFHSTEIYNTCSSKKEAKEMAIRDTKIILNNKKNSWVPFVKSVEIIK